MPEQANLQLGGQCQVQPKIPSSGTSPESLCVPVPEQA